MKKNFIKFLILCLVVAGMAVYADTISVDYVTQIERSPLFPTPLTWVGAMGPSSDESQILCSDIMAFKTEGISAGLDQLEEFLQDYPNSPWAPSLHVNMAEYYKAHGNYSLALKHWQAAWGCTENSKDAAAEKLAARTLAGWTRLLGTLGEKEKLHSLFAEMNARNLPLGTYATTIQETEEGLNIMDTKPGISYRCGSFALGNMAIALHLDQSIARKLFQVDSPDGGFNISQLLKLAQTDGMAVEAVRRPPGADLVVPSVVHWKLNHYAAIIEKKGDLYKVEDPTFAGHVWMSAATIESESSGEYILPKDKVPASWVQLSASESSGIYGKGYGNLIFDTNDKGNTCDDWDIDLSGNDMPGGSTLDPGNLCNGSTCCSCGMPQWYVSEPYISLWLYDSPAPYYQSDGNPMELKVSYKSRGSPQNSMIAGFGDDWACNWIGYLEYDTNEPDIVTDFRAGGGEETFNTNGAPDYDTARMFEYVSVGTSNCPALVTPMGEEDIYGYTVPVTLGPSYYLLTETKDRYGRVLKHFNYQNVGAVVQLTSVIDMDGRTNTLVYANTACPQLITDVTNAYGRSAHFYYSTNGMQFTITNMVDAQSMSSSFQYDQDENITNMITLYGTNSFEYFSSTNGVQNAVTRALLITEPTGDHQLYVYEDFAHIEPDDSNGHDKSSFHWNRVQYQNITDGGQTNFTLLSSMDFASAEFKEWLHGDNDTNNPVQAGWTLSDALQQKAEPYDSILNTRPNWTVYTYVGESNIDADGFNELYTDDTNGGLKQILTITNNGRMVVAMGRNNSGLVTEYTNYIYGDASASLAVYSNTYDASGTIVQREIGPEGETVFGYAFTTNSLNPGITNLLIAVTNAAGDVTQYIHDPATLKLTSTIFPTGLVQTNSYYTSGPNTGFLATQANLGVGTNYFAYANGNLSIETNALGLVTTYEYDNLNRLISTGYPDGTTDSNIYDKLDIIATKDRMNQWRYYLYNDLDQLIATTNVNGQVTTYDYCGCGSPDLIDQIDGSKQYITSFEYNINGLLTLAVYPDEYTLFYTNDVNGQIQSVTDGNGNQWRVADLTQLGYKFTPTYTTLNGDPLSVLQLDQYGRTISSQVYGNGNGILTNGYDFLGRITTRQLLTTYGVFGSPESGMESFSYSPGGLTNYIDQLGHTNIFIRDASGRIVYETNADLEVVKYTYNAVDEPLTLIDGNNHMTTWNYDQYGRMTNRLDAASNASVFQYDPLSRVTNRWTTAKGTTVYRYDPIGNLTNIDYSLGAVSTPSIYYAYDGLNRMTNMADASGANSFAWTAGNLLASEAGPWPDDIISYAYNTARQRSGMTLLQPNAPAWSQTYDYNSDMKLASVISPADNFSLNYRYVDQLYQIAPANFRGSFGWQFSHDNAGILTTIFIPISGSSYYNYYYDGGLELTQETFLPGNQINYTYDNIGQLKTAQGFDSDPTRTRWQEQFGYAYDSAENLIQRTNNALIQGFTINNLNELTNITWSGTYTVAGKCTEINNYPPYPTVSVNTSNTDLYSDGMFAATNFTLVAGNNTFTAIGQETHLPSRWATNSVTTYFTTNPTCYYDANGNLTNDGTRNFAYDDENELVGAWVANTWSNSFVYDGMWRKRIEQDYAWNGSSWLETNEVHFIYDGSRVLQERDANNLPQITYTWGTTADRILQGDRVGGLLARTENSKLAIGAPFATTYYVNDRNGNVMYLLYSNGLPAAVYEYDPFGSTLGMSGPLAGANRFRYSGKEWNDTDGLYYYGRRFYGPSLQRWLNRDPIGERGGLNLYSFVGNNPINEVDPLGLYETMFGNWVPVSYNSPQGVFPQMPQSWPPQTGLVPFLPSSAGVIATAGAEGGTVDGAGGQAFAGGGLFAGRNQGTEIGGFSGYGGFAGGPGGPTSQTPCNGQTPWVVGGSAGGAAGAFLSNANAASQLGGPFDQWNLNTPIVNFSLAISGDTWIFSATSGPGTSIGASVSGYPTTTTSAGGLTTGGNGWDLYVP